MSAGFTPGPWHTEDDAKAYSPPCVCVMSGEIILAEVLADDAIGVDAETVATAHLISAAPEMFAALEAVETARMSDEPSDWQRATDLTDAARAKARGEA